METLLEFDQVTRCYGSARAVDGVSLAVGRGEVFGLLGPSGCGKTTLLRMAAGFDQPDQGRILLDGRDITALPPDQRPVNTVFQNYALFPHLTLRENIAFGPRIAGRGKKETAAAVERMLTLVQLEEHADKRPAQISGGQKQRVAIARALINQPQVLLLDEPLAALDLKLRQRMLVELGKIHAEVGTTFVFVTHDQGEAMGLCDRIAVMNSGRVEQLGAPREIYTLPASSFVAAFIGDTNFLRGTVTPTGLLVPGLPEFSVPLRAQQAAGTEVLLSLRPERIGLSAEPPAAIDGACVAPCEVEEIIYLGSQSRYGLRLGGERVWAARLHDREHDTSAPLQRGQQAWMWFAPEDVRVIEGGLQ